MTSAQRRARSCPHGVLGDPDLVLVPGGGWSDRARRGRLLRGPARRDHRARSRAPRAAAGSARCAPARCCWPRPGSSTGRRAITHHSAIEDLRGSGADVVDGARFVDEGDIITAAGVTSGHRHGAAPRRARRSAGSRRGGGRRDRVDASPSGDERGERVRPVDRHEAVGVLDLDQAARRGTAPRAGSPERSGSSGPRAARRSRPRPRTTAASARRRASPRAARRREVRGVAQDLAVAQRGRAPAREPLAVDALGQPAERDRQPARGSEPQRLQERTASASGKRPEPNSGLNSAGGNTSSASHGVSTSLRDPRRVARDDAAARACRRCRGRRA